jgi:F-type H+-transporting ATPase subunit delta
MEELARVYGRSLFEVALEQGRLDVIREQLGQIADALKENRELAVFFFSPYFSSAEKQQSLGGLLDGADEILINFLELLIENHRMPVIFRVRSEYQRLWDEENKMLPVQITSAIALDAQTTENLGKTIGERAWTPTSSAASS